MALGTVTATNYAVAEVMSLWRAVLTSGSALVLFQNDVVPDSSFTWASLVEATFPGYARIQLVNTFQPPAQLADGQYQMSVPGGIFSCTGGSGQTCYGWGLIDTSLNLWFLATFPTPINFESGVSQAIALNLWEFALTSF